MFRGLSRRLFIVFISAFIWPGDASAANQNQFSDAAEQTFRAIQKGNDLSRLVVPDGIDFVYTGDDRCRGQHTARPRHISVKALRAPFRVQVTTDGKGWIKDCSERPVFFVDVTLPQRLQEIAASEDCGPIAIDQGAKTLWFGVSYESITISFVLIRDRYRISKITLTSEDPG